MSLGGSIFSAIDLGSENNNETYGQMKQLLVIKGETAKIEGKLVVSKSIEIDCEVHGELIVDGQLKILESGYVNADVKTIDAIIDGVYEGNMEASGNVQINESGKVNGNIKTDSLIIEKGGIFSGNVARMSSDDKYSEKKNKIEDEAEQDYEYNYSSKQEIAEENEKQANPEEEEEKLEL